MKLRFVDLFQLWIPLILFLKTFSPVSADGINLWAMLTAKSTRWSELIAGAGEEESSSSGQKIQDVQTNDENMNTSGIVKPDSSLKFEDYVQQDFDFVNREYEKIIPLSRENTAHLGWQFHYYENRIIRTPVTREMPSAENIRRENMTGFVLQSSLFHSQKDWLKFQHSPIGLDLLSDFGSTDFFFSESEFSSIALVTVAGNTSEEHLVDECLGFSTLKRLHTYTGTHIITKKIKGTSVTWLHHYVFNSEAEQKAWGSFFLALFQNTNTNTDGANRKKPETKLTYNISHQDMTKFGVFSLPRLVRSKMFGNAPLSFFWRLNSLDGIVDFLNSFSDLEGVPKYMGVTELNHLLKTCTNKSKSENPAFRGAVDSKLLDKFLSTAYFCEEQMGVLEEVRRKMPKAPTLFNIHSREHFMTNYGKMNSLCGNATELAELIFEHKFDPIVLKVVTKMEQLLQTRLEYPTFYFKILLQAINDELS